MCCLLACVVLTIKHYVNLEEKQGTELAIEKCVC